MIPAGSEQVPGPRSVLRREQVSLCLVAPVARQATQPDSGEEGNNAQEQYQLAAFQRQPGISFIGVVKSPSQIPERSA